MLSGRSWCLSVFPAQHRPCLTATGRSRTSRSASASCLAGCMLLALHAPPCARVGQSGARAVAVTLVYSSLTGGTLSHAATQRPSGHEPHERMHSGRRGRPVFSLSHSQAGGHWRLPSSWQREREREREGERARHVSGSQRQHGDTATMGSQAPAVRHTFVRAPWSEHRGACGTHSLLLQPPPVTTKISDRLADMVLEQRRPSFPSSP